MAERHKTIVIGGGQAGLAMSYYLQQQKREHVILERGRVAERWRTERWDSLRYQFINQGIALPGLSYQGAEPDGFAHYTAITTFIEDYAEKIAAPLHSPTHGGRSCGLISGERALFSAPRTP
jgi:putative flavoprotein involved in K+ transport